MNTNWNDPNFQGFGGRQSPFGKRPPRPKKEHKAIGTPLSRTLINLAVTLIFAAVYFYVVLPPINLQAEEFYFFMLLCCAVYCGCAVLTSGFQGSGAKGLLWLREEAVPHPHDNRRGAGSRGHRGRYRGLAGDPGRVLPGSADGGDR